MMNYLQLFSPGGPISERAGYHYDPRGLHFSTTNNVFNAQDRTGRKTLDNTQYNTGSYGYDESGKLLRLGRDSYTGKVYNDISEYVPEDRPDNYNSRMGNLKRVIRMKNNTGGYDEYLVDRYKSDDFLNWESSNKNTESSIPNEPTTIPKKTITPSVLKPKPKPQPTQLVKQETNLSNAFMPLQIPSLANESTKNVGSNYTNALGERIAYSGRNTYGG